jgi:hypothetical protein
MLTSLNLTPRRCSLCKFPGHNFSSCTTLTFQKNLAHRRYLSMWQQWIETLVRYSDDSVDILILANILLNLNKEWINNMTNFRLIKSFLNLNRIGTNKEIKLYIYGLYHYLILRHYGFNEINSNAAEYYQFYDYLLETFPPIQFHHDINRKRQYGISLETKTMRVKRELKTCPICLDNISSIDVIQTNCSHEFCEACITKTIENLPFEKDLSCAMCRTNITLLSCCNSEISINLKKTLNL